MKYFLREEVVINNKPENFWLVIHGNVLNLTKFIADRRDSWNDRMQFLLAFGGKDISHLFNEDGTPLTETSGLTGKPRILFPPILETAISEMCYTPGRMWSQDPTYHIGRITRRPRRVRIINTITGITLQMRICDEDTIFDIQRKYKERYNSHSGSYIWRKFSKGGDCDGCLILNGTLDANGLFDEEMENHEVQPPSIWLYYTDDLTEA